MKKPAAADGGYNNGRHWKIYVKVSSDTTGSGGFAPDFFGITGL